MFEFQVFRFRIISVTALILISNILFPTSAHAQDIHFSQFYASPLTLNPSLTGNFDGLMRFGGNYRNQWASVSVPYSTASVYTDLNMLRDKMERPRRCYRRRRKSEFLVAWLPELTDAESDCHRDCQG